MQTVNLIHLKNKENIREFPLGNQKQISYFPIYQTKNFESFPINRIIQKDTNLEETKKTILANLRKDLAKKKAVLVFEKNVMKDDFMWDDDYLHLTYKLRGATPKQVNSLVASLDKKYKLLENKIWLTINRF